MRPTTPHSQPDPLKFKYTAELNQLLKLPNIQLKPHTKISNTDYEEILQPLYNWISKLRTITPINFIIQILNKGNTLILKIIHIDFSIPKSRILIPPQIKNLYLVLNTSIRAESLYISNPQSVIVDNNTVGFIIELLKFEGIKPEKELIKQVEKHEIAVLKKLKRVIKENIVDDSLLYLNNSRITYFISIIRMHYALYNKQLPKEVYDELDVNIYVMVSNILLYYNGTQEEQRIKTCNKSINSTIKIIESTLQEKFLN